MSQKKLSLVERAIAYVLEVEGDFVDHPADRGGKTRYGITEVVARQAGYTGIMQDLPRELAITIYKNQYWRTDHFNGDRIANIAGDQIAFEMFDTGVNMHPRIAAGFLQQALNIMNRNGKLSDELAVDEFCGPKTERALQAIVRTPVDKRVLWKILDTLQGQRYIDIMIRNPSQEAFARGWFDKRTRGGNNE